MADDRGSNTAGRETPAHQPYRPDGVGRERYRGHVIRGAWQGDARRAGSVDDGVRRTDPSQ
jgi:hypothetical protein